MERVGGSLDGRRVAAEWPRRRTQAALHARAERCVFLLNAMRRFDESAHRIGVARQRWFGVPVNENTAALGGQGADEVDLHHTAQVPPDQQIGVKKRVGHFIVFRRRPPSFDHAFGIAGVTASTVAPVLTGPAGDGAHVQAHARVNGGDSAHSLHAAAPACAYSAHICAQVERIGKRGMRVPQVVARIEIVFDEDLPIAIQLLPAGSHVHEIAAQAAAYPSYGALAGTASLTISVILSPYQILCCVGSLFSSEHSPVRGHGRCTLGGNERRSGASKPLGWRR
mmetsp:Transcript_2221/g.8831  ORF Transcript_2221/g.8831 Transcript_2221/m.8831 type:complete len:282 (+) Transcript_2221:1265-2110(+)